MAGVNLPMLVRALTYREEPLAKVVQKALSGGREGVVGGAGERRCQHAEVEIINKLGLHARASAKLTQVWPRRSPPKCGSAAMAGASTPRASWA